jgi:hypothetical protein
MSILGISYIVVFHPDYLEYQSKFELEHLIQVFLTWCFSAELLPYSQFSLDRLPLLYYLPTSFHVCFYKTVCSLHHVLLLYFFFIFPFRIVSYVLVGIEIVPP